MIFIFLIILPFITSRVVHRNPLNYFPFTNKFPPSTPYQKMVEDLNYLTEISLENKSTIQCTNSTIKR